MKDRIVIIGAGPTGLGAAYRLHQLGVETFDILEASDHVGGLSASFVDAKGFTWDLGGHVMFSHYPFFDEVVDRALGDGFLEHVRECWVRICDTWVPYPFQNNIRHLPPEQVMRCLMGLVAVQDGAARRETFRDFILSTMGEGLADIFMFPYNWKVWATPLEEMGSAWIGERVSVVNLEKVLANVVHRRDEVNWGPNATFRFPERGGTGAIFEGMKTFPDARLHLSDPVMRCDTAARVVTTRTGREYGYDHLIVTMPLDRFVATLSPARPDLVAAAEGLRRQSCFVVGVGLDTVTDMTKTWMYFPEDNCPFYRVTNFSRYSPFNVPDASRQRSLLCETSYSAHKPESADTIIERTVDGLVASGMMTPDERGAVCDTWMTDVDYSYPVPTLTRDPALRAIEPELEKLSIWNRGRFGAWRYEVGNMDHSVQQGREIVDRLLEGAQETVWQPIR